MLEGDLVASKTERVKGRPKVPWMRLGPNATSTAGDATPPFSYFTSPLTLGEALAASAAAAARGGRSVTKPITCTVPEGAALYLPAYWWHSVIATPRPAVGKHPALALAVNWWFDVAGGQQMPLGCPSCGSDEQRSPAGDELSPEEREEL